MSALSEITLLIGQRAGDLEKAKEIFTSDTRNFVTNILAALRRARSEPWVQARVRIDLPREIDTEGKSGVLLSSQFALARCDLRFKRGTNFRVIAETKFGIEFEEPSDTFVWQVMLVPEARYQRIDDILWNHWRTTVGVSVPPGSLHQAKANLVRFVQRPITQELSPDVAFNDAKQVLEVLLSADAPLAEAVGLEPPEND